MTPQVKRSHKVMANVAAPEKADLSHGAPASADLSPSKAALRAAFPVITPSTLPEEVDCFLSFHTLVAYDVVLGIQNELCLPDLLVSYMQKKLGRAKNTSF